MNEIIYHKNFVKNFRKRFGNNDRLKKQFVKRTKLFLLDQTNPILRVHNLKGDKITLKAFSVTGDIRVIYYTRGGKTYFFDIGTHNQVY